MITPESIKDELGAIDGSDMAGIIEEIYAMYRTGDPEQIAEADELLWQFETGQLPIRVCSDVIHCIRLRCSQAFSFVHAREIFQAEMSSGELLEEVEMESIPFRFGVRLGDSKFFHEPDLPR